MVKSYSFDGCLHTVQINVLDDNGAVVEKQYYYNVRARKDVVDLEDATGNVVFSGMAPGMEMVHKVWFDGARNMWRALTD
jgi:hypothetical protein